MWCVVNVSIRFACHRHRRLNVSVSITMRHETWPTIERITSAIKLLVNIFVPIARKVQVVKFIRDDAKLNPLQKFNAGHLEYKYFSRARAPFLVSRHVMRSTPFVRNKIDYSNQIWVNKFSDDETKTHSPRAIEIDQVDCMGLSKWTADAIRKWHTAKTSCVIRRYRIVPNTFFENSRHSRASGSIRRIAEHQQNAISWLCVLVTKHMRIRPIID